MIQINDNIYFIFKIHINNIENYKQLSNQKNLVDIDQ